MSINVDLAKQASFNEINHLLDIIKETEHNLSGLVKHPMLIQNLYVPITSAVLEQYRFELQEILKEKLLPALKFVDMDKLREYSKSMSLVVIIDQTMIQQGHKIIEEMRKFSVTPMSISCYIMDIEGSKVVSIPPVIGIKGLHTVLISDKIHESDTESLMSSVLSRGALDTQIILV